MTDGFPNKPRILRGAFVEYGLSVPPLIVVFQFNPMQLARNRSLTFSVPGAAGTAPGAGESLAAPQRSLRNCDRRRDMDLLSVQKRQLVTVAEQTIQFDIRLDASDKLDERDLIAEEFGIAPQISTLELMVLPKSESLLGGGPDSLPGRPEGFSFTRSTNPPIVLFIFGRKRVLPVNITSMNITETEFSADLNPTRATVAVSLTVIEGQSVPYLYSRAATEAMSMINLVNMADVANVVKPR